jgi:hypothetical protein
MPILERKPGVLSKDTILLFPSYEGIQGGETLLMSKTVSRTKYVFHF